MREIFDMRGGEAWEHGKERIISILMLSCGGLLAWLVSILLAAVAADTLQASRISVPSRMIDGDLIEFLAAIGFAAVILIGLRNRRAFAPFAAITLAFLGFFGLAFFVGPELAFFLSASLLLLEREKRSFASNNLLILFACALGSLPMAFGYPIEALVLFLLVLSVYDVLGVFAVGFIPHMAQAAVRADVPLLLLAPKAHVRWGEPPTAEGTSAMLGAGDVFVPCLFLASVSLNAGLPVALATLLGTLIGGILNTILAGFIRTGIPALPLLAAGMLTAYYLAR